MKETTKTYIRSLKPDTSHKNYRLQKKVDGKWTTVKSLSPDTSSEVLENELQALYQERAEANPVPIISLENQVIMNRFFEEKYPTAKTSRMARNSLKSEKQIINSALLVLGTTALSSTIDEIQGVIDEKITDLNKHRKITTAVNRLRKYLKLPLVFHKNDEQQAVKFYTEEEVDLMIFRAEGIEKLLIATAFATGLRKSEIWGLKKEDLRGDVLFIERQVAKDGFVSLPKNRKKRKAFILPKYKAMVLEWLNIKDGVKQSKKYDDLNLHIFRHSNACLLLSKGMSVEAVSFHLGHSPSVCLKYYVGHILSDDTIKLMKQAFAS